MAPTLATLPVSDANGAPFRLFGHDVKYRGILSMFDELVINNVDTVPKRKAIAAFLQSLKAVCADNDQVLCVKGEVNAKDIHVRCKRVVVRDDDAVDPASTAATVWYMMDALTFATAAAFPHMSTDTPAAASRKPVLRKLKSAMYRGDAAVVKSIIDTHGWVSKSKVFGKDRTFAAVRNGHMELVEYLLSCWPTQAEVCGKDCGAVQGAVLNGHVGVVEMLADRFSLTQAEVCGDGNRAFYGAVLRGQVDMLRWLVHRFRMGGPAVDQ